MQDDCVVLICMILQDATHVMVDRAAQLESDLEQTALMLCEEMAAASSREQLLQQSRQQCAHQQNLNFRAMTEVANLRWQLQMQHQVLAMSKAELCKTRVRRDATCVHRECVCLLDLKFKRMHHSLALDKAIDIDGFL